MNARAGPRHSTRCFRAGTYSGREQLLGPSNSIRFEPSVTLALARQVIVSAGWGFYWRQSVYHALDGIPGQVVVPSNGVSDRYEGSRPTVQIDWQPTRHLSGARQLPLRLQRTVRGAVGPCHADDELRVALVDLSVLTRFGATMIDASSQQWGAQPLMTQSDFIVVGTASTGSVFCQSPS